MLYSKAMAKQKNKPTQSTDSIPSTTYKNLKLGISMQHKMMGGAMNQVPKATKADSTLYNMGYNHGVKNWKKAPANAPRGENQIYQKGRWEGQNTGKAINFKEATRPSITQRAINAISDFFND